MGRNRAAADGGARAGAKARISRETPLCLGSASPRRREILELLGVPCDVRPAAVDETRHPAELPDAYLARITSAKRDAARAHLGAHAGLLVADTSVIVDGDVLGKPEDDAHARAMIARLAGRAHEVQTRFCIWSAGGEVAETVRTEVFFRELTADAVARYVATGEGTDKAGGYAIQGRGAALVRKINGSYTNVVGLPACEVMLALEELGLVP